MTLPGLEKRTIPKLAKQKIRKNERLLRPRKKAQQSLRTIIDACWQCSAVRSTTGYPVFEFSCWRRWVPLRITGLLMSAYYELAGWPRSTSCVYCVRRWSMAISSEYTKVTTTELVYRWLCLVEIPEASCTHEAPYVRTTPLTAVNGKSLHLSLMSGE
jgi:hypothetical protein